MNLTDRLLTINEAAEVLHVERTYIYRRITAGELKAVDLGTDSRPKLRITRAEIDRFIESRTT